MYSTIMAVGLGQAKDIDGGQSGHTYSNPSGYFPSKKFESGS